MSLRRSIAAALLTLAAASAPAASGALVDNLVGLYQFEGNFLDTSGSPVASHGSGVNGPQFAAGKIGSAMWLPGVRDYMSLNPATLADLDFGSTVAGDAVDFSVSMWIRQDNALADPAVFSNKNWNNGGNTGVNWAVNGNGVFDLNTKGDVGVRRDLDTAANTASLGVGTWSLVVMTVDRDGPTRLYINGVNTGTIPATSAGDFNGGLPWNVGQDGTGAYGVEFTGAVDELAIWRRALSGSEAGQLWNGGAGIALGGLVVESALKLVVNRDTGRMTIENNTGAPQDIAAYQIDSTAGALNPASWTPIAGRLDGTGSGAIDDERWIRFSRAGSTTDFSEGSLGAGTIPAGGRVELGLGAWEKYYGDLADLRFRYAIPSADEPTSGLIDFVGNGGSAFQPLDLNFDGAINSGDYQAFLAGYGTSLSGASAAERHNRGDLDLDGRHTVRDFKAFKASFDALRGPGAFSAMLAEAGVVPEPTGGALVVAAGLAAVALRRL